MLCDCVLTEVAVVRTGREKSAAPAVISCSGRDKHHRYFPGKAFLPGGWEKDGTSQEKKKKNWKTASQLVYQLMCNMVKPEI